MAEFSPDVVRNHVVALQAPAGTNPLNADELDQLSWRAKSMRAAILHLPVPKRPGFWGKINSLALKLYSIWFDRRTMIDTISSQAERICVLEDLLERNNIDIPGGRGSD